MIVDCMIFCNEYDLLESRLEYLQDSVDRFVIVESDTTFSGQPKPYNFHNNQDRYSRYLDRITYLKFSPDVTGLDFSVRPQQLDFNTAPWRVEAQQREYIQQGIKDLDDSDTVLISDVDEIPNRDFFAELAAMTRDFAVLTTEQQMFYYNLRQRQTNPWCGTVISTAAHARSQGIQWSRENRWGMPRVSPGGWHLSYFADAETIQAKIKNFSHQEFNSEQYTDLGTIQQRIDSGQDLFGRASNPFEPVDAATMPADFLKIFGKYA